MKIRKTILANPIALFCNFFLTYLLYLACRIVYLAENWATFSNGFSELMENEVFWGCFKFDTSAIFYTQGLYALMLLFPLHYKEGALWQRVAKIYFLVVNGIMIVVNLADAVYFKYTGRRTTASVFQEFSHENNLGNVLGTEVLNHWYLFLAGMLLIGLAIYFYVEPTGQLSIRTRRRKVIYYAIQTLCLGILVPLAIAGIRGGFTKAVRPITISNANQYVNRPIESALILNTPFTLIRSIGKTVFKDPKYFSREKMEQLYSPIHQPTADSKPLKKNVVVLIMESFAREYIGYYNAYKGYTTFTDSLLQESLTYEYTFSNGRKSIDGMPSILSGIPRFNEPFFITPAAMNEVSGIAGELKSWGYTTAFFHGAENGSMGFEAFARKTGYKEYYGRTEYDADKRFQGEKDFDGTWAIWDEPFMQFYAMKMSELKEPFCTTIFTASSHHPYHVPEQYKTLFQDEPGDDNPLHKCIRYVDLCLKRFFETAQKQPWYKNTIFVLTADHTNLVSEESYKTDLGLYSVPILFFDPSGEMDKGQKEGIAQQIDIMPTLLTYLGYDKPYVAFGKDLLHTEADKTWAVTQENGVYQYVQGNHLLQMTEDGTIKALYDIRKDWLLQKNLHGQAREIEDPMQETLKAIIQDYMIRMTEDKLTVK